MDAWLHIFSKQLFLLLLGRHNVYCLFKNCATEENIYRFFLYILVVSLPSTKITITSLIYHVQTERFDTRSEMIKCATTRN